MKLPLSYFPSFLSSRITKMTNSDQDFQTYINNIITTTKLKGSHQITPTKDFTKVLSALIEQGIKNHIHVKSVDNTIYLAIQKTPLPLLLPCFSPLFPQE